MILVAVMYEAVLCQVEIATVLEALWLKAFVRVVETRLLEAEVLFPLALFVKTLLFAEISTIVPPVFSSIIPEGVLRMGGSGGKKCESERCG
ncbi:hypothetical protein [Terriglobus saanensis]|uniref:hypothetical protein n=1 Tax=Terriglobus saanensis TaxID=870903 RepID=UPI001184725B|nr:hypothetical protein [Terriglobus saanensis]